MTTIATANQSTLAAHPSSVAPWWRLPARGWRRLSEPVDGRIVPGTMIVFTAAVIVGLAFTAFAFAQDWLLLYLDAQSHLVIARRILDSQNPGLFQLGTAWLPAPHVLLLPLVAIFPLYSSGLAGALLGTLCLGVSAGALWRLTSRVGLHRDARLVVIVIFVLNPTTLFLSTTALTEPVLIAALLAAMAGLAGWITAMPAISPGELAVFAGIPSTIAVLSRYEGWAFVALASAFIALAAWRRWRSVRYTLTLVGAYLAAPLAGIVWWFGYNFSRTGNPLDFLVGEYSAGFETARYAALGLIPTDGNLGLSITIMTWAASNIIGPGFLIMAAVGGGILLWSRGLTTTALLLWMPGFIYAFQLMSLFLGQTYIENPASLPADSFTNNRYAYGLLLLVAVLCGVLVDFVRTRWRVYGVALGAVIMAGSVAFLFWNVSAADERMVMVQEGNFEATPPEAIVAADWLREHYRGGKILLDDDPQGVLLRLGLPLSEVTNVFNGEIFLDAIKDPGANAEWIFANMINEESPVWKTVSRDPDFDAQFVTVFESGTYRVFQNIGNEPIEGEEPIGDPLEFGQSPAPGSPATGAVGQSGSQP